MQKPDKVDYAKLLGFDSVSGQLGGSVDFQDEIIGAKLGAKVGHEALVALDLATSHTEAQTK